MDLNQRKLNKSEWESTEVPVSPSEIDVLKMIIGGYADVNTRINKHNSIFSYLKIEYTEKMEDYLYIKYLSESINNYKKTYKIDFINVDVSPKTKINSADKIRIERNDDEIMKQNDIYEFVLLHHIEGIFLNMYQMIKLESMNLAVRIFKSFEKNWASQLKKLTRVIPQLKSAD
jgi:hypothetical protein